MSKKFEKRFWELEERFEDMHPAEVYNQGSPKLMEIITGILEDHMDWDDEDEKLGSYLNWEVEMITAMYNVFEVYL